jgi:hypothetical protein
MVVTSSVSIALSVRRSVQTQVPVIGRVRKNAAVQSRIPMIQTAAIERRSMHVDLMNEDKKEW